MKLKKFHGNPILSPNPDNEWESLVTCNPGVYYDEGIYYMLYRAAGNDKAHVIRFGLAVSNDGFHFKRCSDAPAFAPRKDNFDGGSVEDPRIVKFDDTYYITYAYRPFPPGQYWNFAHDVVEVPDWGKNAPKAVAENLGNTALAATRDFKSFRRLGRITSPVLDDRDVILFPEKINGRYALLHRPKNFTGRSLEVKYPSIWIKFSEDLLDWETKQSHLLLTGKEDTWEEKVGGSTPPIKTDAGWLLLYHGVDDGGEGYYRVGALLLDISDPTKIIAKSPKCILEPESDYEIKGFYKGCVFPTGNVVVDGTLFVYYGGADKYVCVATCPLQELLDYLLSAECRVD